MNDFTGFVGINGFVSFPAVKSEAAAAMQEQLARRDHRIAVLDAICDAQRARIAALEARECNGGSPATVRTFEVEGSYTVAGPPEGMLAIVTKHLNGSGIRSMERLALLLGNGVAFDDIRIESAKAADPRSELLSRAIAADKPLDAYARR